MNGINVLIACEESQAVCKAFRRRGFNAYSCDLQYCSGGMPEYHIQEDVTKLLNGKQHFVTMDGVYHVVDKWDLIIAHPPCTYLSNAGARWLYAGGKLNEDRYKKGIEGKQFFLQFYNANCEHVAIENPIPSKVYNLPPYSQVIQPYEHGEPWSKKTCLWLKGLPLLQPTNVLTDYKPFCSSGSYSKSHDAKYKGANRKGGSAKSRSKTFYGVAQAMAEQWGNYLIQAMKEGAANEN